MATQNSSSSCKRQERWATVYLDGQEAYTCRILRSGRGWKLVRFKNGGENIYSSYFKCFLLDAPAAKIDLCGDCFYYVGKDRYGRMDFYGREI